MPTLLRDTATLTTTEALSDLCDAATVAGRAPATIDLYRVHVGRLTRFLGDVPVDQVTTADITRFLAGEQKRGLKPASLHIALRTLRRFFAYVVEQGHLAANPASKVIPPRVVAEPVKFMGDDQFARLLDSIERARTIEAARDIALLRTLADTGLRRGELAGLRTTDLSDDARLVTVRPATSKTRRGRVVPVSAQTAKSLRIWLRVRSRYEPARATESLWVGQRGTLTPNGLLQVLRRRLEAAGLPMASLHSFRHKMAATAIEGGLALPLLQEIGGWSGPDMIMSRYGTFDRGPRAVAAMQALLDGKAS